MLDNFNFFNSPKDYEAIKCDEEKNHFLCDSKFDRPKYSTLDDSM